jgi:hypothetical protein
MGGWITIAINGVAAYLFYSIELSSLMILSIVNGIISFWSFGVMSNYAINSVTSKAETLRKNMELEGSLDEEAEERLEKLRGSSNPDAVPNWLTVINMLTFVIGIILLASYFFIGE